MSQPFSTQAPQQLSGSGCPPVFHGVEITTGQIAQLPTLFNEARILKAYGGDEFTPVRSLPSPGDLPTRTTLNCMVWASTLVFLELRIKQK